VTLPEDAIAHLSAIDVDLGKAIVAILARRRPPLPPSRSAELSRYGSHAVIVVAPINALKRLPGVQLVPIGQNRSLISLKPPRSLPQLELEIRDALENGQVGRDDREALDTLAAILRDARHSKAVSIEERTIIVLEAKRQRS